MNELHYTGHKWWSIFTILVTQAVLPDVDDGSVVEIPLHHIHNVDFLLVALDLEEEEGRLGLVVHDHIPDGALEAAPSGPEALEPLHERVPVFDSIEAGDSEVLAEHGGDRLVVVLEERLDVVGDGGAEVRLAEGAPSGPHGLGKAIARHQAHALAEDQDLPQRRLPPSENPLPRVHVLPQFRVGPISRQVPLDDLAHPQVLLALGLVLVGLSLGAAAAVADVNHELGEGDGGPLVHEVVHELHLCALVLGEDGANGWGALTGALRLKEGGVREENVLRAQGVASGNRGQVPHLPGIGGEEALPEVAQGVALAVDPAVGGVVADAEGEARDLLALSPPVCAGVWKGAVLPPLAEAAEVPLLPGALLALLAGRQAPEPVGEVAVARREGEVRGLAHGSRQLLRLLEHLRRSVQGDGRGGGEGFAIVVVVVVVVRQLSRPREELEALEHRDLVHNLNRQHSEGLPPRRRADARRRRDAAEGEGEQGTIRGARRLRRQRQHWLVDYLWWSTAAWQSRCNRGKFRCCWERRSSSALLMQDWGHACVRELLRLSVAAARKASVSSVVGAREVVTASVDSFCFSDSPGNCRPRNA